MSPELKQHIDLQFEELLKQVERLFPDDKPARRQCINDTIDSMIRDYNYVMMCTDLTEEEVDDLVSEYTVYITNLACADTFQEYTTIKNNLENETQHFKREGRIKNSRRY